jgi:hypothetical protein
MNCSYKIIYDIKKDMWNWRGALEDYQTDQYWLDNINSYGSCEDKKIAGSILGLKKQQAESILKPYLESQKSDPNSRLNSFIKLAEKEFEDKFAAACQALERITDRPIKSDCFTFYITSFPRMTIFHEKYEIFMYDSTEDVWGMPIDGFLHEGLHIQFIDYWRNNNESPVSKLNETDFFYLKEALTVILDDEIKPIITVPDMSYQTMAPFRNILHEHWKKYHDFDKLVAYGLKMLPKYIC